MLKGDKSHSNNDTVHRGFASDIFATHPTIPLPSGRLPEQQRRYLILSYSLKRPVSQGGSRETRLDQLAFCRLAIIELYFSVRVSASALQTLLNISCDFPGGGGGTETNHPFRVNYGREKKEHSFRRAADLNGKHIALARNSRISLVRKVEIAMTVVR